MLLDLRTLVATLAPGRLVHVIATDPAAALDLPAWCHLTGHTWLGPIATHDRPAFALRVAATARATDPTRPWHPSTDEPEAPAP
jgi:tRNA 2-thiouridine synthesizing protein A